MSSATSVKPRVQTQRGVLEALDTLHEDYQNIQQFPGIDAIVRDRPLIHSSNGKNSHESKAIVRTNAVKHHTALMRRKFSLEVEESEKAK